MTTMMRAQGMTFRFVRGLEGMTPSPWKISASSFLVPTAFGAQFVFHLYFLPKLTHPAAWFVCNSWPAC